MKAMWRAMRAWWIGAEISPDSQAGLILRQWPKGSTL